MRIAVSGVAGFVGSNREITIEGLACVVWRLVRGDEPRIKLVPLSTFGRYEDVDRRVPDNRRAARVLGHTPAVPLEDGLARTIAWQREVMSALQAMFRRYGDGFITSRGFECMVEVLYRAAPLHLRISEVPMVLDGSRRVGRSKMRVLRTSLAYLRLAVRGATGRL